MNTWRVFLAIVLVLHGLVHIMGLVSYLKLGEVQGIPYKTTVLDGRLNLGHTGTGIYGVLWAVAALGFVLAATGLLLNSSWWLPLLTASAVFSLVITTLDLNVALAGVVVNAAILVMVWITPQFSSP
jgi:hypothetical protein